MAFYVGQKVVCVDAASLPGRRWNGDAPTEGGIYTVTSVHVSNQGHPSLWFAEIKRAGSAVFFYGPLVGYHQSRFRPLVERKTSIEVFQRLLIPSEREKERA